MRQIQVDLCFVEDNLRMAVQPYLLAAAERADGRAATSLKLQTATGQTAETSKNIKKTTSNWTSSVAAGLVL